MPLKLSQPAAPERALSFPAFTKRSTVQVAPLRVSRVTLTPIQLDTHPCFLYFEDPRVEQQFQAFVRREKQRYLPLHMGCVLALAAIVCGIMAGSTTSTLKDFFVATFAKINAPPPAIHTVTRTGFTWIIVTFYVAAGAIAVLLGVRRLEFRFAKGRLCNVQLAVLVYCHLVLLPILVAIGTTMRVYSVLVKFLARYTVASSVIEALGDSHLDTLVLFLLVIIVFCGLLLRLQFWYFVVIFVECLMLLCVFVSVHFSASVSVRAALFVIFSAILCLVLWAVYENEQSWRLQFVSSCNLITENRRLSNQNIEMKEELSSSKPNSQMQYEMGDILRILCQLKVKMTASEKTDIDRIITSLVMNRDLYEVRLSPGMSEYDKEVQGWLHLMASKQTLPGKRLTRPSSSRHLSRRRISAPTEVLPVASSRRFSQNLNREEQISSEAITKLLSAHVAAKHEEMSQWLFEKIRNEFFIDIFYIDENCFTPLQIMFVAIVELNDFVNLLSLDITKVTEFAGAVETHYFNRNPYHNALHAAAVVADMNFYLRRINLDVDDTTFFVALVAAAAHDISHPGVTNGFLIATKSKLAITYSDDSVLERMHVAELYRIMSQEKYDIFSHMSASVRTEIRRIIIGMVLATDLARHFTRISRLKSKQFGLSEEARGVQVSLIMETLLMLSDLGHTAKPFEYHQLWASRITEEFYLQGDAEERRGMPISPLCDRRQANLPKSQVTFLTVIATPLFEAAGQALSIDEYSVVLDELRANTAVWQGRIDHDAADSKAAANGTR